MSDTESFEVALRVQTLELRGDERLLMALLAGKTVKDAAADAGMSRATADRRLASDDFRRRFDEARRGLSMALGVRLAEAAAEAAEVLRALMVDPETPPTARVRAAGMLLASTVKVVELEEARSELASRLERLEEQALAREHRPSRRLLEEGA